MSMGFGRLADVPLRRERSDGIDALRAVLALWVVLAHLIPWTAAVQGPHALPAELAGAALFAARVFQPFGELHPAVLAFIVLSGYCIHRGGLRQRMPGALAGYAVRRFFRIGPLYYVAIGAGLAGFIAAAARSPSLAVALSGTTTLNAGCVAAKALALSAFFPGLQQCVFLGNAPLVTVLVEIVLYILYAVAFVGLVWRGRERAVGIACGTLFVFSLAMLGYGVSAPFDGWWQNGSVFAFLPYWWLGVAFANPDFARTCNRRLWLIVAAWGLLTVLLLTTAPPGVLAWAEIRKLCFALAVGVLIERVDRENLQGSWLLAPLGRAGYGLYAIHAPLTYSLLIYGAPWWSVLIADIAAGLLIHQMIERPMIGLGRSLQGRLAPGRGLAVHRS